MKERKKIKVVLTIMQILCFISFCFLAYSVYLIKGVETELRYIAMAILFLLNIAILFLRKITKKEKIISYIIYIVLLLIFIVGQLGLGYFLYKTYSSINNINKQEITYSSVIVVLKDSPIKGIDALKDKKIGIINDKTSIDEYVLANKIVKDEKLNDSSTIVEYESLVSMIKDLYDKKIEAIITTGNYVSILKSLDGYENVEEETNVIKELEKTYSKSEISKITGEEEDINYNSSASITEPFTVLLMGIDSEAKTLDKNATGNGDALMLVTFNPKTLNATILSIPRDSFVYIPRMGTENKITHAAWGGTSSMIATIEGFTGIDIDYYVKVNFQGVIKLVDLLGGITVDVPIEFCESNEYRETSASKQICLKEGVQTLTGSQALALARHRKTLLTGDLQRGTNQQLVVQGALNQAKTIRSASQALNILDTMSNSMDTNFTTKQLLSFYDIFKTILETSSNQDNLINIQQLYLAGLTQGIYDERTDLVLSDYIINDSSLKQCVSAMKQNLGKEKVKMIKDFDFDIEETFEMETIGTDDLYATKLYTLLPDFIGDNVETAKKWLSNHGLSYTIEERESTSSNGKVLDQNYPEYKRIDLISGSVKLVVSKQTVTEPVIDPVIDPITDDEPKEDEGGSSEIPGETEEPSEDPEDNTEE